jgi:hypothetical protein
VALEQTHDPVAHFRGRIIGKGDGENFGRVYLVVVNEVRNAVG